MPVIGLLAAACGGDTESTGGGQAEGRAAVESCYEGETATFVVPFSPGGGYDTIARGLAPFLENELGADAVHAENMPRTCRGPADSPRRTASTTLTRTG